MAEYYSTPARVITYTGVRPGDLNLNDDEGGLTADEKLEAVLEMWLGEVKSLMDRFQGKEYEDPVPEGIHNIATRACAHHVTNAKIRREQNIIRIDEYAQRSIQDFVLSNDIREDLKSFESERHGWRFA